MSNSFYPSLSTLVPVNAIPDSLGILKTGVNNLFDNLYFRDLQISRSKSGDASFYKLSIVTYKKLAVSLPGLNDVNLVLNPSFVDSQSSEFGLSLGYKLPILRFVNEFDIASFDFSGEAFYNLLLEIFSIAEANILYNLLYNLISDEDPIAKFISDFNEKYNTTPSLIASEEIDEVFIVEDLLTQIKSLYDNGRIEDNIYQIVLKDYILTNSSFDDQVNAIQAIFSGVSGFFTIDSLKQLITPQINVSLDNLNIALEFPRKWLKPIYTGPGDYPSFEVGKYEIGQVIDDLTYLSRLKFDVGSLQFSSDSGFDFKNTSSFKFYTSEIQGTGGMTIGFTDLKLDLSRDTNIPEADAAGYPTDFVGVFIGEAEIGLPKSWKQQKDANDNLVPSSGKIVGRNVLIGTGGISGTFGLEAITDPAIGATPDNSVLIHTQIGGLDIGLSSFDITFKQGKIISSNIEGKLTVKGFNQKPKDGETSAKPAIIDIIITIQNDGDFVITAKSLKTPYEIEIPNAITFLMQTLSVGKKDDKYFIGTSGKLLITQPALANTLKDPIDVQKLIIWSDGEIEFSGGGTFTLKEPKSLELGPVKMSITAIHLGAYEKFHGTEVRKYKYVGFDGGISINPGGVEAKGSGIKFYFTTDNTETKKFDWFMRIQSISLNLMLSGSNPSLQLRGMLSSSESGDEYTGGVTFKIKSPSISGSAVMRLNPKKPAFLVDISLELPTPILLASTGLGIYGFRALVGQRYVPTLKAAGLSDTSTWYQYYKAKVPPSNQVGVQSEKFEQKNGLTLGAGASIATSVDGGKTFSSKVFLMLSMPGLFMIQGQAAVLKERLGLLDPKDPPFSLLLIVSDEMIQVTIGVDYQIPEETGLVLKAHACFDMAFYFNDSSKWYINLGTEDAPLTAVKFSLFRMYAFLMINDRGIKMGGGTEYKFNKQIGPLKIDAYSFMKFGGKLNFKPLQVGGFYSLGGGLSVTFCGVGFAFMLKAGLAGEAPKPFIISGNFAVSVKVLFKKFSCSVELTWKLNTNKVTTTIPLLQVLSLPDGSASDAKAINILTEEAYSVKSVSLGSSSLPQGANVLLTDDFIVPVDSFINIEFAKSVQPSTALKATGKIGSFGVPATGNVEVVPPQKGKLSQLQHNYIVEEVNVYAWNETTSQWVNYNIYEGIKPVSVAGAVTNFDPSTLPIGYWQVDHPNKMNKLSILARTSLNYLRYGTPPPLENLGLTVDKFTCPRTKIEKLCTDFTSYSLNDKVAIGKIETIKNGARVELIDKDGAIKFIPNVFGYTSSLFVSNEGGSVALYLPETSSQVNLKLASIADTAKVSYYKVVDTGLPTAHYELVKEQTVTRAQLTKELVYEDTNYPVDKVVIIPGASPDETVSCTPFTQNITELQDKLNLLVQTHQLTVEDPNQGHALNLEISLPHQFVPYSNYFMPSGYTEGCRLHLEYPRETSTNWSFVVTKSLNNPLSPLLDDLYCSTDEPGGIPSILPRKVSIKISDVNGQEIKTLQATLPDFNKQNPQGELQVITNQIYTLLSTESYLTLSHKTSQGFEIKTSASVGQIEITYNNAFEGAFSINTGAIFDYNQITSFSNLIPDTSTYQEGMVNDFKVTATLSNGSTVVLNGNTTCFPVVCCSGKTSVYAKEICDFVVPEIEKVQARLTSIVEEINTNQRKADLLALFPRQRQKFLNIVKELNEEKAQLLVQNTNLSTYRSFYCSPSEQGNNITCGGFFPISDNGLFVFGMCWMKKTDYDYNASIPDLSTILANTETMIDGINKTVQPIWRPNTKYSIVVGVRDDIYDEGKNVADNKSTQRVAYLFQTKGPVGHFLQEYTHFEKVPNYVKGANVVSKFENTRNADGTLLIPTDGLTNTQKDGLKLKDLKYYIDYSKSYPNADGNLLNAKPLYTSNPKLYVFYMVDYIKTMFSGYEGYASVGLPKIEDEQNRLEVIIKDPVSESEIIPANYVNFVEHANPVLPADIQTTLNILNAENPCLNIGMDPPKGLHQEIQMAELQPLKLYSAQFSSKYEPVVLSPERQVKKSTIHTFNFQTSRYKTFSEHINSYRFVDEDGSTKDAVYDIKLALTSAQFATALKVVNNTLDPSIASENALLLQYAQPYDRLIDGVLKVGVLPAAVNLEFNIVRDFSNDQTSSDYVLGILVRSPEPFNDPKIPLNTLQDAISVVNALGEKISTYNKVILSTDRASAFITQSDMHLLDTNMKFRFDYLTYSGAGYVVAEHAEVSIGVPSSLTQLIATDCGAVEIELNDTLQANLVANASEYKYLVEGSNGYSTAYDSDAEGKIALGQLSTALHYNQTYTVRIKNKVETRLSSYGPSCTIRTKELNFTIQAPAENYTYLATNLNVTLKLVFKNGALYDSYNGKVTLTSDANVEIDGVLGSKEIQFTDGQATVAIKSNVAHQATLSLSDTDATGYNVSQTQEISFIEIADKIEFEPITAVAIAGGPTLLKLKATGPSGYIDKGLNNVQVTVTGEKNIIGLPMIVNINKGESQGNTNVNDYYSEEVTLSLSNVQGASVVITDTLKLVYANLNARFEYIINNLNPNKGTSQTVGIRVKDSISGLVDSKFNRRVLLTITGDETSLTSSRTVEVSFVNGIASNVTSVTRSTVGDVSLSLSALDGENLGLPAVAFVNSTVKFK